MSFWKCLLLIPGMSLPPTLTGNVSDCPQTIKKPIPADRPEGCARLGAVCRWEQLHVRWQTGYAVTTTNQVTREKALPSNVSSQKPELIASMKDLKLSRVVWKERRLAASQGNRLNTLNRPMHWYRIFGNTEKQLLHIAKLSKTGKQLPN